MCTESVGFPAGDLLTAIYAHHLWANDRLFTTCRSLTEDQLTHTVPGTYGSIRATLAHIVRAEERYMTLLTGREFTSAPRPDETTPLAELQQRVATSGAALLQLARANAPGDLVRVGEGSNAEQIPANILLLQAIYHSHEHRAQICTILGNTGIAPPSLSSWAYFDEMLSI